MTFSDLIKLIRHYLKLVIALPLACALVTLVVFLLMPPQYEAKASLANDVPLDVVSGYANNVATEQSRSDVVVTATTAAASHSIIFKAESANYDQCVEAANTAAHALGDELHAINPAFMVDISEATSAIDTSVSASKMALVALLAGLFIAICVVLIIDLVKTPIRSEDDIEALSDLPVVSVIPSRDSGERLLANIRFVADKTPSVIAVVPVGLLGTAVVCADLMSALERSSIATNRVKGGAHEEALKVEHQPGTVTIIECSSLTEGMGAAYLAKEADITVVCVREWADSRKALAKVVGELRLARANVAGVVFLTERRSGFEEVR